jgi:hypothetical protein
MSSARDVSGRLQWMPPVNVDCGGGVSRLPWHDGNGGGGHWPFPADWEVLVEQSKDDSTRAFLRHTVATVAYRGGKALEGAPPAFSAFRAQPGTRTPGEILAHISDLFDWALHLCRGEHVWRDSVPSAWESDVDRFFRALQGFDELLASPEPLGSPAERLLQGPLADALTHIGQINLLRRMAGNPIKGENYFKAEIVTGRSGREQPAPKVEFE